MEEKIILKRIAKRENESTFYYEEKIDSETNQVIIETKMTINLTSNAAKKRLNKSWKKDKSPLLTELQQMFRDHERDKKEEKESEWYSEI